MAACPTCGQSGCITPYLLRLSNALHEKHQKYLRSPTCGQRGYITPALPGVANAQRVHKTSPTRVLSYGSRTLCAVDKNQQWLPRLIVGKVVTSPLPSWEPTMIRAWEKIKMAYVTCKTRVAILGQCGYIADGVLVVHNTQCGDEDWYCYPVETWAKWLHQPCRLRGSQHLR